MLNSTQLCKHTGLAKSCFENVVLSFSKTFSSMLFIKMATNNVLLLSNPKDLIRNLLNPSSHLDNFRFAMFAALINSTYKFMLCFCRRKLKNDKASSIIAAVAAAQWLLIEPKQRRQLLTLLLLTRAIDSINRKIFREKPEKKVPYFNVMVWAFCVAMFQYAFSYEVDCLNPVLHDFFSKLAVLNPNEARIQ